MRTMGWMIGGARRKDVREVLGWTMGPINF
jgi:hypothetical protein